MQNYRQTQKMLSWVIQNTLWCSKIFPKNRFITARVYGFFNINTFFSGQHLAFSFNWRFTNLPLLWSIWKFHQFLEMKFSWICFSFKVIDISMETMNQKYENR